MTWWGKDKEIRWFKPEPVRDIINYIENILVL
jgi:hypothetical protein